MSVSPSRWIKSLTLPVLVAAMLAPLNLPAADHVVGSADIQKTILAQARARQADLSRVQEFFSSGPAARALERYPALRGQVVRAVPQLDDQELARLAVKVGKIQRDFAAGALSNQNLTYIVIALATAVVVLIIVEA